MLARHRHHDSSETRKMFTITLESCSRSAEIRVHNALETVTTIDRNMHELALATNHLAAYPAPLTRSLESSPELRVITSNLRRGWAGLPVVLLCHAVG
jgi:hypothetical protein